MKLIYTALLLGVAGFDPTGAIVIISALTMGASKKQINTFALTTFIGTVITGVVCSCFVGNGISYLSNLFNYIPDIVYVVLEFIVAFLLLKWFAERVFFKPKKEEKKESFVIKYIKKGLFVVGLIFAITALTDPSFLGLITLSGHSINMIEVIMAHCVWILISQSPIFVLTIAIMLGKHEKIIAYFDEKISKSERIRKLKKAFSIVLTVVILLAGLLLFVEAVYYLTTNNWLF